METNSLRLFLQSLCRNSPWDYAVFWKLQHGPHMLLTWEDGHYDIRRPRACNSSITDDACSKSSNKFLASTYGHTCIESLGEASIEVAMAQMSTTYYAVGEGIVGEAAYVGVPRWIFSDNITSDGLCSCLVSQCADDWLPQFVAGIKTILLIPSMPEGVLQLGSFELVTDDAELVADIKDEFAAYYKFAEYPSSFCLSMEVQHHLPVMMSALAENLDKSSANMRRNIGEDPRDDDSFKANRDQLSNAEKIQHVIPVSSHIFDKNMPEVQEFETGFREHVELMNVVDAIAPATHQLVEQNIDLRKSKIDRYLNPHEMGVFSSFSNNYAELSGDYADDMIDFYLDGGVTGPPLSIDCDIVRSERTGKFLSFPRDCELHKALGLSVIDHKIQYMQACSDPVGGLANSSGYSGNVNHCVEPLSWDSNGVFIRGRSASCTKGPSHSGKSGIVGVDSGPWSFVTSAANYEDALTNTTHASASNDHILSSFLIDERQEKRYDFLNHRKRSDLSTTKKGRATTGNNHKSRPRDRQLIQDRIKELRELVPNGAKCSIDGLLNKAMKHMVFLQSITDRADKLRQQAVIEVTGQVRHKFPEMKDKGMSWALDLADEKDKYPIIVKDLKSPGQMLIEIVCDNYSCFLDIADVIHRLELSILKGVMKKRSDSTWAHFVVEATGSFHRLDLFWPLMQLLQRNQVPIRKKI